MPLTHAQALARAQAAVDAAAERAAKCPWRPAYHFAAPANWINDPNGLIHFRGEYHLFYQHYPHEPEWGPMHWGHAVSSDCVRWRHLPIALAPSEAYELADDACGCFSGSAIEHDGQLVLMYTGHLPGPRETQNIATSRDGVHFTKHPANPVIGAPPAEGSGDFRDPKVWKHGEHYYVICGTCKSGVGKVVLYRSDDLLSWQYVGVAAQSDGTLGKMWECPDLFELDGEHVLLFSPMGLGWPLSMYLVGRLDYETGRFAWHGSGLVDHGSDFYAPQTMLDASGRRIMIGWMEAWGAKVPTCANGWSGAMTIARELRLRDGRLIQQPLREAFSLRGQGRPIGAVASGDCVEIILAIDLQSAAKAGIRLRCSTDGSQYTAISWDGETLALDRERSGAGNGGVYSCKLPRSKTIQLRVLLDRSSVEVFANDGETAITGRIYPDAASTGIRLFSENGEAGFSGEIFELRP